VTGLIRHPIERLSVVDVSASKRSTPFSAVAEPGTTESAVSRRHGVGPSLIHNLRGQEAVLSATVHFTPVAVKPEMPLGGAIEIELDGVQVGVDAAVDEEALKRVLRAPTGSAVHTDMMMPPFHDRPIIAVKSRGVLGVAMQQ
jgi:hypothetical protein